MKPTFLRTICALAASALFALSAMAEDIDLFTGAAGTTGPAPNILIILDNSSNWNRNDQQWPTGKQGQSELQALKDLMDAKDSQGNPLLNSNINVGLMMFTSAGSPTGAYVRYHIRGMTDTNKAAFKEMIGDPTCTASLNSLMGTPNCILANFNSSQEETNSAATIYEASLFETFKYFGGYTDPAHASTDSTPSPYITDSTHFGPMRYSGLDPKADPAAFQDASKTIYNPPLNADGSNSCARNYVIFIGNGYPSNVLAASVLTGINGNATVPAPVGNKANLSANWSEYDYRTDVNAVSGRQYVNTYTLDVYNAHQDTVETALLGAMAKYGGGEYFAVHSESDILIALEKIIIEIQSVNSVFASASLPINATNRSQNANQVYIGMFRPDPKAEPRWYGNLKQYQVALFGTDPMLADVNAQQALSPTTGFLAPCSTSFWTTDSGDYWAFSPPSGGTCTVIPNSANSDLPDGPVVEKGGAAEVLRRGNDPSAVAPFVVNRTMYTEAASFGSLVPFNSTNVTQARTGAATATENQSIVDYTFGKDVNDENLNLDLTEPRPSIHGDIAHSRPLPVNYGGSRGVVIYYGANDGAYRAVDSATGKELWSFVAPEHHAKLRRLYLDAPLIDYPTVTTDLATAPKDYFFDGATGLYQNADNSKVWIYPTMRRGGRMLYAFDVTGATPVVKWSIGCPDLTDDTNCSAGASGIGQTWSTANVGFAMGYNGGNDPLVIMGGGYDGCEDADSGTTSCATGSEKGARVYVIDANTGAIVKAFNTDRAVPGDVALVDRNFDGKADHAYAADTGGNLYRVDFVDPVTMAPRDSGAWTITKVASTGGAGRKFLFGPAVLALSNKVILTIGSGDRERPLITNYPYKTPILNRFYMFMDSFGSTVVDLDGSTMSNFTSGSDCNTVLATGQNGWFMNLDAGTGEQTVTSSVIFGGTVYFSTNRPLPAANSCSNNLGEARGYAVNLLNASGVIGTGGLCGGSQSGVFDGGGLPPSPVIATVPVALPGGGTKLTDVCVSCINAQTGGGSPVGLTAPPVPIKQKRTRVYWYPKGDQ